MSQISQRSARVAEIALQAMLRKVAPALNGHGIPDDILTAMAELRIAASTASGTGLDPEPVAAPPSEQISTAEAARRLGLTPRAVRKRCAAKELPATRTGRDWLIEWRQEWQEPSSTTLGTPGPTSPTASTTG